MTEYKQDSFFRAYNLTETQKEPKKPAAHQHQALDKLQKWYQDKNSNPGGILVLPTGGGKTFTAMRFLCTYPLSNGYKVLWLAHTHHLLDQAFYSLESEVKLIRNKQKLNVRVVSGTKGHFRPAQIEHSDDIVICTLQTITRAYSDNDKVIQFDKFLKAAGNKLFVVFDEAHHSPAPSYCRFITALRKAHANMYLLGLTATPTHSNEKKVGWLNTLFPQGILYQISPNELMAAGVLAQPIFETSCTTIKPDFDESKYKEWVKDFRDLPEEIITELAKNRERNAFIAKTYTDNKERYGKTIIFTDRWFQCEQLREFIQQKKGIRVGTVYTHIDADPGSADARNKRGKNENAEVLDKFRNNQLDVLINVRMLTEGTDVPNVESVFLTRQTTSQILMTQMVGRGLRGTKFGGTKEAYIVSFIDDWQQAINWAEYKIEDLPPPIEDSSQQIGERVAMQLISIDLVRRLIEQINSGVNVNIYPFLTLMPIGWYRVEIETCIEEKESTEIVQRLVMVFEHERTDYEKFIEFIKNLEASELKAFVEPVVSFDSQIQQKIKRFQEGTFSNSGQHIGGDLLSNLFYITCHLAQNDRESPDWFDFQERQQHDLDDIAQKLINLSRVLEDEKLREEYNREDRYWKIIYQNYELFKSQYNACAERLLSTKQQVVNPKPNGSTYKINNPPLPEPSDEIKRQVKQRDNNRCLCCRETQRSLLVVDHIIPKYHGGNHLLSNLQTLCRTCNKVKGTKIINFLQHQTPLITPPSEFIELELPKEGYNGEWEQLLRRSINFFYQCAAVESLVIGGKDSYYWYHWLIYLHANNNPRWLVPCLKKPVREIRYARSKAGLIGPSDIFINAPGFEVVTPITG